MPKTEAALNQFEHLTYLENFVKLDDNSFPNMMAMLIDQHIPYEMQRGFRLDYLDTKFPYIWNKFKDAGYVTAFTEVTYFSS